SDSMEKFADRYKKVAGEWNDEAGTKVYALEIIIATLQKAGPDAINNERSFLSLDLTAPERARCSS
ncbi:MAG TPA: hypothetical protein VE154_06185, partial [Chthoniobacterales bacterium]|nr:hypothetical protein [Chthoniobacterales bacterium]